MKKNIAILNKIEDLTERQKLDLFKVEELETRLEMAAFNTIIDATNSGCSGGPKDSNDGCTSNSSCGW
jgi:hypothetical protein